MRNQTRTGRAITTLAGLLVVGALAGWFLLREECGPQPGVSGSDSVEPLVVERRPVREPLAARASAERADLEGVDAVWIRLNNEATRLLELGELERAFEMFERCYAAQPDRAPFRRNLAEALVRLARREHDAGEQVTAITRLDRALALAPERGDAEALRANIERWRREAELERDHWTEASDLFELSYDTGREDILKNSQRVLDHLEQAYELERQWFGSDPVRELGRPPIRVVLYNQDEFDRLTGLGDWAGGVFDGVVRISVEDLQTENERWRRVLSHELVHAFVVAVGGPSVPGWLNEGLAQLREGGPTRAAARARLAGQELFDLERLQGSLASWSDAEEIGRAYAQSLLLVDLIATEYGEEALRRMVLGVGQGQEPAAAFEAWTNVPLEFAVGVLAERLR